MSLALTTQVCNHQLRTKQVYINVTPSGLYVPGGDPINFNNLKLALGQSLDDGIGYPGNIKDFAVISAPAGFNAKLIKGSNLTNWGLKVFYDPPSAGIYLGLGTLSAASTLSAVVSKVGTITVANTLQAGNFVYLSGFTQLGALNGTIVKVASATATQFTFNLGSAANVTSGADTTGHFQIVQASATNPLQLGSLSATITSTATTTASLLTITAANTFQVGQFVYIDGLAALTGANGVIVRIATASATQFTAVWTGSATGAGAESSGTATLVVTAGGAPIIADYITNVTNSLATASSAGTAGLITLTATQSLNAGNIFLVNGLTNGAAVNGDILTVIASGTTNAILKANGQTAAFSSAADIGAISLLMTGDASTTGISGGFAELPAGAYPAAITSDSFVIMVEGPKGQL